MNGKLLSYVDEMSHEVVLAKMKQGSLSNWNCFSWDLSQIPLLILEIIKLFISEDCCVAILE